MVAWWWHSGARFSIFPGGGRTVTLDVKNQQGQYTIKEACHDEQEYSPRALGKQHLLDGSRGAKDAFMFLDELANFF